MSDNIDTLTLDIPLFLRLLEYAREEASSDMDLHRLVFRALTHKQEGVLGIGQYDLIVPPTTPTSDFNLEL